jgi:thiamine-monophosphate kinase
VTRETSERSRIERLARWLSADGVPPGVLVSIGDDAAVLAPGRAALVATVDVAVEGVHFRRDWLSMRDIGHRSLMAAASDLAAMGARPRGVLSSLILPSDVGDTDLEGIARGQADAARLLGTAVIGGNLSRGGELSVTTTVLGEADRPLTRGAAKPGDLVAVAGPLGLARAGLLALEKGERGGALDAAIDAWRRPRARVDEGLAAARTAHAAIDLSDGLAIDAWRVAEGSRVRIVLRSDAVLAASGNALLAAASALGVDPLELALVGGEDYALLATFPSGAVPEGFTAIGVCAEGCDVALQEADGSTRVLPNEGFDHFA